MLGLRCYRVSASSSITPFRRPMLRWRWSRARRLAQFAAAGPALSGVERAPSRLARATGAALLGTVGLWRGIVPFTHLAREERMTVASGLQELLAAVRGAAA